MVLKSGENAPRLPKDKDWLVLLNSQSYSPQVDKTGPVTCQFWLDGMAKGFILGFLGPRPLREVGHLWGYECLGLSETMQLIFGNWLLLFSLETAVALYLNGGSCLVEHPSCPEEPQAASIWRLPIVQFLLTLPGFELISLA